MGSVEHLSLQWVSFDSNYQQGFSDLREKEELFDVTLISGSRQIKAHKVILSACSPVFRSMIRSTPFQMYPLIYLRGVNVDHLELLISFMYNGEVNVIKEELVDFISIAEEFQVKCLVSEKESTSLYIKNDSNVRQSVTLNVSVPLESRNEPEDISWDKNKKYIEALDLEISRYYTKTGKIFRCHKCNYSTSYGNAVRNHIESNHITSKGFVCSVCNRKFRTRLSLYGHSYKTHRGSNVPFKRYRKTL